MTPPFSIGFCHNGTVRTEFFESVLSVITHPNLKRIIRAGGPYIHINRNLIVKEFLAHNDAEWLLFIDNDIQFTMTHIDALFTVGDEEHKIVAGLYFTWILGQFMPCWFASLEPPIVASLDITNYVAQPLASCGMGFTAIHRDVLLAMQNVRLDDPSPWFAHDRMSTLAGTYVAAEDATFCMRAKAIGFQPWGVQLVVVNHFKTCAENLETFNMRTRAAAQYA